MELKLEELDGGIKLISLSGRMDVEGTEAIDLEFNRHAATDTSKVIVDLSEVNFMASIGLRTFVSVAKAQKLKGGALVLAAPQPNVKKVLETTAIDQVLQVFDDVEAAKGSF